MELTKEQIIKDQKHRIETMPQNLRDIYDRFIMPVDTDIDLSSVILSDENKSKINTFITEMAHVHDFEEYGLKPMNRLLFYGASGTGKTYTAKALSNHLGYTMLYIDIAQALTDDTVSKNVSDIFKLANYLEYCVLMLDECDSIAWQRDTGNGDTGTIRRATNSIFQSLDQMKSSIVFISATNMLHRLDNAFERRFNMKLEYRRPELDIKDAIKHFIFPAFEVVDDVDKTTENIVARRAGQYAKLSYYEIQGLVERAMKKAVIDKTYKVHTADIYRDLAIAMRVKLNFKTDDDPEEIFYNNSHY